MATETKQLRAGSVAKRSAILSAGRDLFLSEGFERTSVDAIAARAVVSKRTVYDYFGDKRSLLLSVVEDAVMSLMGSIQQAITDNLTDVSDLETSLVGFAEAVTSTAIGSADYTALTRLVETETANLQELRERDWGVDEPEEIVAQRLAEFGRQGLLEVPNPRLAADHFVALTLYQSASGVRQPDPVDAGRQHTAIVEGVRAFLRAYAPR